MTIKLPFPPTIYKAWKVAYRRGGNKVRTSEYESYRTAVQWDLMRQKFTLSPLHAYALEIFLHSPNWFNKNGTIKRADLDNYIKCLLDPITAYLTGMDIKFDDCQITDLHAKKVHDTQQTCAILRFTQTNFP